MQHNDILDSNTSIPSPEVVVRTKGLVLKGAMGITSFFILFTLFQTVLSIADINTLEYISPTADSIIFTFQNLLYVISIASLAYILVIYKEKPFIPAVICIFCVVQIIKDIFLMSKYATPNISFLIIGPVAFVHLVFIFLLFFVKHPFLKHKYKWLGIVLLLSTLLRSFTPILKIEGFEVYLIDYLMLIPFISCIVLVIQWKVYRAIGTE